MRVNWSYIKMFVLLVLVAFLFAFASQRNAVRKVLGPQVKFIGESNLFVTNETVSKLLIQKYGGVENVTKETLDLNELENVLKSNPMIKAAEVYVAVNGTLSADIEQKTPIARVSTNASYYIDGDGSYMPLSTNFSARVPLVTGYIEKNNLRSIYKIASKIINDEFLKKHVIEIHQNKNKDIYLKLRQCNFIVQLGDVSSLDKKVNNLKAFYQKNLTDKTLNKYSKVNLQFDNQVICTKI
ncbi:cell division protein FtsQ/DivIB [Flavivirga jejuensis]|uniref:Cell division protein FtsQ/DivIB n=2 Tax=Flavivirga jejuensis TaxID=870487 RepID=A0ABT8WVY0_9FLAO|nr:cell division protein FtsQ/DivIB [Flavivirga jejuensis]MDO5977051.1 cell division protein FtsQ/DivIB [Flavivirga jejuensis]